MKDNKWINNKIEKLLIEMSFLFTDDTDEANIYTGCEAQCELLKEMLNNE